MTLVAEDFLRHVEIEEGFAARRPGPARAALPAGQRPSPSRTRGSRWKSRRPQRVDFGPASVSLRDGRLGRGGEVGSGAHRRQRGRLRAHAGGRPALRDRHAATAPVPRGAAKEGESIETPWMGMKVTVDQLLPHASHQHAVVPRRRRRPRTSASMPAVKVHLESADGARSNSEWLPWTEARELTFARTHGPRRLSRAGGRGPLPGDAPRLQLRQVPGLQHGRDLRELRARRRPGARRLRAPHLDEPPACTTAGYIFFQASFVEGEPMMSIFSVARAPGLPLVYLGTTLIGAGRRSGCSI